MINDTYKTNNASYNILSVQRHQDDPSNYVYRVVGSDDSKHYKIKIERPNIVHEGEPVVRKDQA